MLCSADDIAALWALVWGWVTTDYLIIIVGVLTVALVLPVVLLATKTIACACCRYHGFRDNNILPVAMCHHGKIANTLYGAAGPTVRLRSGMEVLEEGLAVSPALPPSNILQMTFPDVQPPPCPNEVRMLKDLQGMYVLLVQTLDGTTGSMSAVARMNAACSAVSKNVATFRGWRASAAVMALLQPAKDVTDLFSRRSRRSGSGAMSMGRQAHYVALLTKRAKAMEDVLTQALWANTMPTVPANIRDAVSIIALMEKLGTPSHKASSTTCKPSSEEKAAIAPGVDFVPYPHGFQLADSSILQ